MSSVSKLYVGKIVDKLRKGKSMDAFEETLNEYEVMTERTSEALSQISAHKDFTDFLRIRTRFGLLKLLLLKLIRTYTRIQTAFNVYVSDYFKLNQYQKEISGKLFLSLARKLDLKQDRYHSLYFDKFQEEFYLHQQKYFRAPEDDVFAEQKKYLKLLDEIKDEDRSILFVDLGCGRGEFLRVLKEGGFSKVLGVDLNSEAVANVRKIGFNAVVADCVEYIQKMSTPMIGVSAFHLLEHLEFEKMFDLVYLMKEKLVPGGVVIVETPNIENLSVGGSTFYYDHTHKNPLLPQFLKSVFEFVGYSRVNIVYLSPAKGGHLVGVKRLLYGPRDYAIIAWK